MDEATDDSLSLSESVPAGVVEGIEDTAALREFIDRADALRGTRNDPKLKALIEEVRRLLVDGFRPVCVLPLYCHRALCWRRIEAYCCRQRWVCRSGNRGAYFRSA